MFLITRSLVQQARGRAVIIVIHYCGFSGSSANWNCPSFVSCNSYTEKFAYTYRFQVTLKDLPRHQHLPNTLTNNCCDQIHLLILHRDPLARKRQTWNLFGSMRLQLSLAMACIGNSDISFSTNLPPDSIRSPEGRWSWLFHWLSEELYCIWCACGCNSLLFFRWRMWRCGR